MTLQQMVNRQIIGRGITNPLVIEAMLRVDRREFVQPGQEAQAFDDGPLPIGGGQTISQPYIVALMTELAAIDSGSRVLEVGTGSGYQTAILAEIAAEVYSIEIVGTLAPIASERLERLGYRNVRLRVGDGYQGWPESAPFDAILVTAAPSHIPAPLIDQLKTGGRLVIPLGRFFQELEVMVKTPNSFQRERIIAVRFVPMTGEAQEN